MKAGKVGDKTVFTSGRAEGERGVITECRPEVFGVPSYTIETANGHYFCTLRSIAIISCIFNKEGENG